MELWPPIHPARVNWMQLKLRMRYPKSTLTLPTTRPNTAKVAGAIINLTTKAGTKQFHGDLYTYFRNEDLNANDYFNNLNNVKKPRYRYVIGGGSVGGPVVLPFWKSSTLPKTGCSSSSTINTLTRVFLTRWWKTPCLRLWNAPVISLRASPWAEP